jgi:hypothetical protein
MIKTIKRINENVPKAHLAFWWFVRILLICCFIYSCTWLSNPESPLHRADSAAKAAQATASLAITFTWEIFYTLGRKIWIGKISYKTQTLLCFFLIFACVIGSYLYLYDAIGFYDIIMHTFSGIISGLCAYEILLALFNSQKKEISKPAAAAWIMMFVISVACVWEIYEFAADSFLGTNMQLRIQQFLADFRINVNAITNTPDTVKQASAAAVKGLALKNLNLHSAQSDSALYDTMTDIISGVFGGIFITTVIIKKKYSKKINLPTQKENNFN